MVRITKAGLFAGIGVSIAAMLACVAGPRVYSVHTDHVAALMGVHNEHLASLMKSISRSHARIRSERLPLRQARRRAYATIAECATELAGLTDGLDDFTDSEGFSEEDSEVFRAYVHTLRRRASELRDAAGHKNEPEVKRAFAQLTSMCNSCHFAFREPIRKHHEREHVRKNDGE